LQIATEQLADINFKFWQGPIKIHRCFKGPCIRKKCPSMLYITNEMPHWEGTVRQPSMSYISPSPPARQN